MSPAPIHDCSKKMDKFYSQLDQFLANLPVGSVRNLAEVFHRKDVITLEEKREVEGGGTGAKATLMSILRTTREPAKLRAISKSLQAFKLLYKDAKSQYLGFGLGIVESQGL